MGPQATDDTAMEQSVKALYVGKTLYEVETPAAVLDLAKVEVNCERMLATVRALNIGWRAHIKTHKTIELTKLQISEDPSVPANIVVSTVLEAEKVLPLLMQYKSQGRAVNVLFSFPLYPSCIPRLSHISTALGPQGLSVMIDHPSQIPLLSLLTSQASSSNNPPLVFLKVDMGYHRAGVIPSTPECVALVTALLEAERAGACVLHGLYAHAGHSYSSRCESDALALLAAEFAALRRVGDDVVRASASSQREHRRLVLSVGATPTTTSLQQGHPSMTTETTETTVRDSVLASLREAEGGRNYDLEVHAGVYPVLDLQQLATHARDASLLSSADIAVSVLAEVASVYRNRHGHSGPGSGSGSGPAVEALINAGCLALGREPCQPSFPGRTSSAYSGWGIAMPWGSCDGTTAPAAAGGPGVVPAPVPGPGFPVEHGGWEVVKVSQEHGLLGWVPPVVVDGNNEGNEGSEGSEPPVVPEVGGRVRIWPNHACIAGAGFDKYVIVDSRRVGKEDEIVDVWRRWNGW